MMLDDGYHRTSNKNQTCIISSHIVGKKGYKFIEALAST